MQCAELSQSSVNVYLVEYKEIFSGANKRIIKLDNTLIFNT